MDRWVQSASLPHSNRDAADIAVKALAIGLEDALGRAVLPLGRRTAIEGEPGIRDQL